jgi:hypothetical protein
MKALTVRQPWATLIVRGLKAREYRCWSPYKYLRFLPARILIHSATAPDRSPEALAALAACRIDPTEENFPLGVVVGSVLVITSKLVSPLDPMARYGRVAWLLAEPAPLAVPVPARGQLGLWDISRGTDRRVV